MGDAYLTPASHLLIIQECLAKVTFFEVPGAPSNFHTRTFIYTSCLLLIEQRLAYSLHLS